MESPSSFQRGRQKAAGGKVRFRKRVNCGLKA